MKKHLFIFILFSTILVFGQTNKEKEMLSFAKRFSSLMTFASVLPQSEVQEKFNGILHQIQASDKDYTIADLKKIFNNDQLRDGYQKIKLHQNPSEGYAYLVNVFDTLQLEIHTLSMIGQRNKFLRDIVLTR